MTAETIRPGGEHTDQFDPERDRADALLDTHPEFKGDLERLLDPELSRDNFIALINELNSKEQPDRGNGAYQDAYFDVSGGRRVKVKWFESGRIEVSGGDHNEE